MIRRIFKYPIPIADVSKIELPENAWILTVQTQHEETYLWALVDPEAITETRIIRVIGTGHPVNDPTDNLRYISTFQMIGGSLIFHVFELLSDHNTKLLSDHNTKLISEGETS